jgi:hypothetical protein
MSVIRVGSTSTYAQGWDAVFGGRSGSAKKATATKASRSKKTSTRASALVKTVKSKKKAAAKPKKTSRSRRG